MVRTEKRYDGEQLRLVIDQPKGNIISVAVIRDLCRALATVRDSPEIKLVTIEGAGAHFSFGASVEEHKADAIEKTLAELHGLIRELLALPAPTAAIVRGRCLGGGFELALACDFIFAADTAQLGVPEIALGVFPPAAAALLPVKIGVARATQAVLTGAVAPAARWASAGLVTLVAPEAELDAAVAQWFAEHLAARSAAALRCACEAVRTTTRRQVDSVLPELERLYLDTLMKTNDASEGIAAFLEKRQPVWSNV